MRMRLQRIDALVVFVCGTLLASPAFAQFTQQGPKLVASDATGRGRGNFPSPFRADCNTAIVGGSNHNAFAGAAWIGQETGAGVWTQQGTKLVGSGAAGNGQQGTAVAISADGTHGGCWRAIRQQEVGPHGFGLEAAWRLQLAEAAQLVGTGADGRIP